MSEIAKLSAMAQSCMDSGQLNEAMELYNQVCELDSENAEARLMLGAINAQHGNVDDGIKYIQTAIKLDHNYPEAHLMLANIYKAQNKLDMALEFANNAVSIDADYDEAWVLLSGVHRAQGHYLKTVECARRALKLWPENTDVYNDLAYASSVHCQNLFNSEQFDEAYEFCVDALNHQSNIADLHFWKGRVLDVLKATDHDVIESSYREAIAIQPNHVAAIYQLARLLEKQADGMSAVSYYQQVIELSPDLAVRAKFQMAHIFLRNESKSEAIELLHAVLEKMPDHTGAQHTLASLGELQTPAHASKDYVVSLFDEMSDNFEKLLVNDLDYHIPELMRGIVGEVLGDQFSKLRILDLGCGTGLTGYYFRDCAQSITGIDLSPKMLKKAEEKGCYDILLEGDLVEVMKTINDKFDLIVSADVFVYVGDISSVFQSCAEHLEAGGFLAFSIELEKSDSDYVLRDSGRYSQSIEYVDRLCAASGFEILQTVNSKIRNDYNKEIEGRMIVVRKL